MLGQETERERKGDKKRNGVKIGGNLWERLGVRDKGERESKGKGKKLCYGLGNGEEERRKTTWFPC